jgi:hypothetical protein
LHNPWDQHLQELLLLPNEPAPDRVFLGYHDEDPTGLADFFYFHFSYQLISDPRISLFDTGVNFGRISSTQPIPPLEEGHVFVLMGFDLGYRGEDHHVKQIGILEDNNNITVFFSDDNDNVFQWRVKYASVPADLFSVVDENTAAQQQGFAERPIPGGPTVIRGFLLNFEDGDHHIRDVGILTLDGRIRIAFSDENGDDFFRLKVRWGILVS